MDFSKMLKQAQEMQQKMMEAKEHFLKQRDKHNSEHKKRQRKVDELEKRLKQKENSFNQKFESANRKEKQAEEIKKNLERQIEVVHQKQAELDKEQEHHIAKLEQLSNLSAEAEALSGRLPAALPNSVIGVTAERVEPGLSLVDHPSVGEGRGASEIPPDMKSSVPE